MENLANGVDDMHAVRQARMPPKFRDWAVGNLVDDPAGE
jgi:hypothetical protein